MKRGKPKPLPKVRRTPSEDAFGKINTDCHRFFCEFELK